MKKKQHPKPSAPAGPGIVHALTAGAMALPGLAAGTASADSPVEEFTIDGEYSRYEEDDLRPSKTAFGGSSAHAAFSARQLFGRRARRPR